MEIIDPKSVKKINEARKFILDLQKRLFQCEQVLDDLAHSAEIVDITKQTHLMQPFIAAAQMYLENRLTTPDVSQEYLDLPNIIIEDDRKLST
jgi:hypothetical protein